MRNFKSKVVIVTGGGSGIGRATAVMFASEGAQVVIADIDIKGGGSTERMIKEASGEAIFVKTDVSKSIEVENLVKQTIQKYGKLDAAFNNAGILTPASALTDLSEETWDRVININLKGIFLCMKYEIPQILKSGGGAIVNVSSISGLTGSPGWTAYTASKHGVIGLTRTAALEFAKRKIRINSVCPCQIDTPMISNVSTPDYRESIGVQLPNGRIGEAQEVASVVVWLCSDEASLVNGAIIPVDGGWTAGVAFWEDEK